jgi:hypothetical protein
MTATVNVFVMRRYEVNITNLMGNSELRIQEVKTMSRDIFLSFSEMIYLKSGESFTLTIYVCPTRADSFSSLIVFETSRGPIPYAVKGRAILSLRDTLPPTIHYATHNEASDISFPIPLALSSSEKIKVRYDRRLLNLSKLLPPWPVNFRVAKLDIGYYWTFVHMQDMDEVRSFPLVISMSVDFLQALHPVAYLPIVTTRWNKSEVNITIVNRNQHPYNVTLLTLANGAPSNVKIVFYQRMPIICERQSDTVVGAVRLLGEQQGDVDTRVTVTWLVNDHGPAHQVEIPVRGRVEYGSFEPSTNIIFVLQAPQSEGSISFTNKFPVPVIVAGAHVNSTDFVVAGFTPFIVQPGARSPNIVVQFITQRSALTLEATLVVETSATNHWIPVRGYTGELRIAKSHVHMVEATNLLSHKLGKVPCGSEMRMPVLINNQNPTPATLSKIIYTDGINASASWSPHRNSDRASDSVPKFDTRELILQITFRHSLAYRQRNDNVWLNWSGAFVNVMLQWTPQVGAIWVMPEASLVLAGVYYNSTMFINSTYPISFRVTGITPGIDVVDVRPIRGLVREREGPKAIGIVSMVLSAEFLKRIPQGQVFQDYRNISEHIRAWERIGTGPITLHISISIHLAIGVNLSTFLNLSLNVLHFSDVDFRLGYVLAHSEVVRNLSIQNNHNGTIAFHGESFDTICPPNRTIFVAVPLRVGDLGHFNYSSPVTTNATRPFFLHITGKAVAPRVRLRDAQGISVTELRFGSQVTCASVWLSNDGKASIAIAPLNFTGPLFALHSDCPGVLTSRTACRLNFSVDIRAVTHAVESYDWRLEEEGMHLVLVLTVDAGEKEMIRIAKQRAARRAAIICVLCSGIVWQIGVFVRGRIATVVDARRRGRALRKAIDRLSGIARRSIGTEVVFEPKRFVGVWIVVADTKAVVSEETLAEMTALINEW